MKKKILFALIPAAVLFGCLELACLVWERFDPPLTSLVQAAEDLPEKGPNEFRVLFYGGSTVAGEPETTVSFVAQVESYFDKLYPDKVIFLANYGRGGLPSAYTVRVMYQSLRNSEADAIVVLTTHNEFLLIEDMSDEEVRFLYAMEESMHRSALVRRARRMYYRMVTARRADLLSGDNLTRFDEGSARHSERVATFESNMKLIVEMANRSGAPLFLCTGPSNIADWPPAIEQYSRYGEAEEAGDAAAAGYREAVGQAQALLEEGNPKGVLEFCEEALQRYPGDASLTYRKGRACLALGRVEEARELLYRARDLDTIPFRVLSRFNETIRGKDDPPRVKVVDLARLFDANSPDGLTGFDLVADNCHPTPQGSFLIATALLDAFAEAGLLERGEPAASRVSLDAFLEEAKFERRKAAYHLTNARTVMKPPYHNFDLAGKYLRRALEAEPDNWQVLANLATVSYFVGETEEAERYLAIAIENKGSEIDVEDREATPYLKEAMDIPGASHRE